MVKLISFFLFYSKIPEMSKSWPFLLLWIKLRKDFNHSTSNIYFLGAKPSTAKCKSEVIRMMLDRM
jgi:hypothetical protein